MLTLKLAGYFAKHIQARGGGGFKLVHNLLINLHSNNHHLISRCCHGNKTKKFKMAAADRHHGFSIFEILLNIKRFCWKQLPISIKQPRSSTKRSIYYHLEILMRKSLVDSETTVSFHLLPEYDHLHQTASWLLSPSPSLSRR